MLDDVNVSGKTGRAHSAAGSNKSSKAMKQRLSEQTWIGQVAPFRYRSGVNAWREQAGTVGWGSRPRRSTHLFQSLLQRALVFLPHRLSQTPDMASLVCMALALTAPAYAQEPASSSAVDTLQPVVVLSTRSARAGLSEEGGLMLG
jgi:hypothetical protein